MELTATLIGKGHLSAQSYNASTGETTGPFRLTFDIPLLGEVAFTVNHTDVPWDDLKIGSHFTFKILPATGKDLLEHVENWLEELEEKFNPTPPAKSAEVIPPNATATVATETTVTVTDEPKKPEGEQPSTPATPSTPETPTAETQETAPEAAAEVA